MSPVAPPAPDVPAWPSPSKPFPATDPTAPALLPPTAELPATAAGEPPSATPIEPAWALDAEGLSLLQATSALQPRSQAPEAVRTIEENG